MREGGYTEKRKTKRYDMTSSMEYVLTPRTSGEVHKGVLVNISKTGISAYVFSPHSEGQKIFITSRLPVDYQSAIIAWIKKKDDDFYLAGLKFTDQGT
jgi:c-di-GMP-binding flagellar brake protein YcgR